jgi:Helicase conserved C-terminal domain
MERYPDIDDPDFQFLIARRLEFRNLYNVDGLYPHQEFVRRFMSPYTPYDSLIMYHSLGSGKSIACIAVAVDHYLHDGKKCIIVTKGDSGTSNFEGQIGMYCRMSASGIRGEWKKDDVFVMKHYISMSNQVNYMSDDEVASAFSNRVIVLDEVHNVRYLKKVTEDSVYGSIVRVLKLCNNVKTIIATATPMTDNHEQIHSLLGICNRSRGDPGSMSGIISYNCVVQDKPASTHWGTYDYVPGVCVHASLMRGHQREAYSREDTDTPPDDIYRKLTHISLFCFEDGTHGKSVTEDRMSKTKKAATITSMSTKRTRQIKYVKYSVLPEFATSLIGRGLRESSSKYSEVINLLEGSSGNVFIFLEEVKGSGLLLLASILEHHGYELYLGDDIENMRPGRRYTMCVGSADICPNNEDRLEGFNCDANMHGDYVRVLLGSRVIGESITLKNVRQFCCLTPHWNDSTVDQAIGRVVRNGSHSSLPPDERHVNIYIHASIYPDNPRNSIDIKKLERCKDKEVKILEVAQHMVECAVDRYCLDDDPSLPVTHVDTFAAAYIHHHEAAIAGSISRILGLRQGPINVQDLSDAIDVHPTVCMEVLCRTMLSNTPVHNRGHMRGRCMFVRAYGDTVFTVDDPSMPYVMMPPAEVVDTRVRNNGGATISGLSMLRGVNTGFPEPVQAFRYMRVKDKAAFLEECIRLSRHDILEQIHTTYACIDGTLYHLLLYRDLENSYTSSNPVPKKPLGRTRAFDPDNRTWRTLESAKDELPVLRAYRGLVDNLLETADNVLSIYGVISTIDGEMRLRLRDTEDRSRSSVDKRFVKRGKNMRSIRKGLLLDILYYISGTPPESIDPTFGDCVSINEIALLIDTAIVNAGLYIIL